MSVFSQLVERMPVVKGKRNEMDVTGMVILALALLCVAAPLQLGQLTFGLVGALCYAAVQAMRKSTRARTVPKSSRKLGLDEPGGDTSVGKIPARARPTRPKAKPSDREAKILEREVGKPEYRQQSSQPVAAPSFVSNDFDAQVQELLDQAAPTPQGDALVQEIVCMVRKVLHSFIPDAEIMGFACGDILRGTAFAVAIPEVDVILSAAPDAIAQSLMGRASRPLPHAAKLNFWRLQKSMLRACTDELTAAPGFKFRRSAFKGQEPKVTLMAELLGKAIPIDFSVNTVAPLHNAALLTECGHIDTRAKELVLLVRRWAKYRGVSHAAKGHLAPYAWSLLVVYFLQVWEVQGDPLLPELKAFKQSSSLLRQQQRQQHKAEQLQEQQQRQEERPEPRQRRAGSKEQDVSVGTLFKEFFRFYSKSFQWRSEAISVRAGKRLPPSTTLPLHIVTLSSGATDVAPSIEDPFEPKRNLSECMTGVSFQRFHEEIDRGVALSSEDSTSLSEFLEPWVPPERNCSGGAVAEESAAEA
mmetsp:Transcript_44477/g.123056  ORF Transcript_44477/g.123056 Transcript_44477/m.123056 type:complete len:529 (-) Transcript_44477:123-1709(-)|eukprot:CAMPEP_0117547004 /NCGR_PEP_ID=MMETSP0784-20121206/46898_1 /TAXON_ID=39447 /ORGANISM="" /LENGTH=528 /DNA_ID=CAMNT_0005343891 /DNA_START=149 /DNA_END=1735 /DNA_ORIENTATION=-